MNGTGPGQPANPTASRALAEARLTAERDRLLRLGAGLERDHDATSAPGEPLGVHLADAASDLFERERLTSLRDDVAVELDEVRLAFERLEAGRYGVCEHCEGVIPDERLEAMPATRLCVLHEERYELQAGRAVGAAGRRRSGGSERSEADDAAFLPTEDSDDTSGFDDLTSEEAAMHVIDDH